jgi:hypothetical protein
LADLKADKKAGMKVATRVEWLVDLKAIVVVVPLADLKVYKKVVLLELSKVHYWNPWCI